MQPLLVDLVVTKGHTFLFYPIFHCPTIYDCLEYKRDP